MIIKAVSRKDGADLARYLLKQTGQQEAFVIDHKGSAVQDLKTMFRVWEEEAYAVTKRAQKPLYHLSIRLADGEKLTMDQWLKALETVEAKLHLHGHGRAVVGHRLDGELHIHAVYSRLRPDRAVLRELPYDRRVHHQAARQLEQEFGLRELNCARGIGRNGNPKTRSAEHRMAKEVKISRQELCDLVKAAWLKSNTGREFELNLAQSDITMAPGEKRDYILQFRGKTFSPVRLLEYVRVKEFRAKMAIDPPRFDQALAVTASASPGLEIHPRVAERVTREQAIAYGLGEPNTVPSAQSQANSFQRRKAAKLTAEQVRKDIATSQSPGVKYGRCEQASGCPELSDQHERRRGKEPDILAFDR